MTAWEALTREAPLDEDAVERVARDLLARMTAGEKLHVMSGDEPLVRGAARMPFAYNRQVYVAGEVPRLGIPGIRFTDGPRGVVVGHSTAFPVSMARGATFDPDLEERIGDAIGVEARAQGANLFAGVCVNLLRHPGWGRAQETYGEDSHLLGEMGAGLVRGTQRHLMACVKHYAVNSIENSRFRVDVTIDDATLRDLYLPHFRRCVDEGAASMMSAYNRVNGEWASHSRSLLTEILKREWGFDGFVMSDFVFAVRDAADAVNGGLDLEMPFRLRLRRLPRLVRRGRVHRERVDDAALRLLRQQLRFAGRGEPDRYRPEAVAGGAHRALAREAAEKSIVLLQNEPPSGGHEPLLPLDVEALDRVAVIGKLAGLSVIGDHGSSRVRPPGVVTVHEGLRSLPGVTHLETHDGVDIDGAGGAAARSDVAIVVVGLTHRDEGEYVFTHGGDRTDLRLRRHDERLIQTVAAANARTVVVLLGGSALVTEAWRSRVPAVLMAWYPGMEGGHAIAAVLSGAADPGGRLPCTWPRAEAQLPPFDPKARRVEYGPLHGYRLMEAEGHDPAFWFGHGLSYTAFAYGEPRVVDDVSVEVDVRNTGGRRGSDVVQCYLDETLGSDPRALKALRGFRRVELEKGESTTVRIDLDPAHLDEVERRVGTVTAHVGPSADPARLQRVELR